MLELPDDAEPGSLEVAPWRWQGGDVVLARTKDHRLGAVGVRAPGDAAQWIASSGRIAIADDESFGSLAPSPISIREAETAIGVRLSRWRAYAGGGGEATVIQLFARDGRELRSIASTVVEFTCTLAGAWSADGSRDHHEVRGTATLEATTHVSDGHFDLVKRAGKETITTFQWARDRYVAHPRTARSATPEWGDCEIGDD